MERDLTIGSPMKLIIRFAVPTFLGMLFQQFYNMVDAMIVGKFLGVDALAGVGSTGAINFVVLGFCMGICNGFAIPIAQMFGARKESELRKYVANSTWLCIGFSVILTVVVVASCRQILVLLNTPEDIFSYAYDYIVIIFAGIPCIILYNMVASIIRSLGDSKTPVYFLAVSSVLNIVLDILFILTFHMGVAGAAWATVLSQGVSGVVCLFYMGKSYPILRGTKAEWKIRTGYMGTLCGVGVPMGLQYSITGIGSLVLQFAVNGLGATVVAGVTAAQKIMQFTGCPFDTLGQTMAPYSGQNLGAGKYDRIRKGLKIVIGITWVWCLLVVIVSYTIVPVFIKMVTGTYNDKIVDTATLYLKVNTILYFVCTIICIMRNALQGIGDTKTPVISSSIELITKVAVAVMLTPYMGYMAIIIAEPVSWVLMVIPILIQMWRNPIINTRKV